MRMSQDAARDYLPRTTHGAGTSCQNCHTTNTPLWRRDESGQVLCNACGLFLKLHGRARPISLKTDIIKSRNRVRINVAHNGMVSQLPGANVIGSATSTITATTTTTADRRSKKSSSNSNGRPSSSGASSPSLTPSIEPFNGPLGLPPMVAPDHYRQQFVPWPGPPVYGTTVPPYPVHLIQPQQNIQPITSPSLTPSNSYRNGGTSVLDQLSAVAYSSPYMSPSQQESDTRAARTKPTTTTTQSEDSPASRESVSPGHLSPQDKSPKDASSELQTLRTRVSELELVNDLYKSRLTQLESSEAEARRLAAAVKERRDSLETKNLQLTRELENIKREFEGTVGTNKDNYGSELRTQQPQVRPTRGRVQNGDANGENNDDRRKKAKLERLL